MVRIATRLCVWPAPCLAIPVLLAQFLLTNAFGAEVVTGQDTETGLRSWTWSQGGVSIQLLQLLPDQTRAFFLARGFGAEQADRIALSCVFQTIFRNDGTGAVSYDLNEWSVTQSSVRRGLRTREVWDGLWEAEGVDDAPRIALRWSLLPTVQRFEAGDYNWGMTSFGLPPGDTFDLSLVMVIDGRPVTGEVPSVACSQDR